MYWNTDLKTFSLLRITENSSNINFMVSLSSFRWQNSFYNQFNLVTYQYIVKILTLLVLGMLKKSHEVARHNLESTLPQKCNGTKKIRKFGRAWIWEQFLLCSKLKCFEFSRQKQVPSRSIFYLFTNSEKTKQKNPGT